MREISDLNEMFHTDHKTLHVDHFWEAPISYHVDRRFLRLIKFCGMSIDNLVDDF